MLVPGYCLQRRVVRFTGAGLVVLCLTLGLLYSFQYDLSTWNRAVGGFPPSLSSSPPEDFRDHAVAYCSPDSSSGLTCFHSRNPGNGETDSTCFGRGADFDVQSGKFSLECDIRSLSSEESDRGLVAFESIRSYWYETGPPEIFKAGVHIHAPQAAAEKPRHENADNAADGESETHDAESQDAEAAVIETAPKNFLLLKREGESNPWHCLLEIFSAWISFDVLRISRDPTNQDLPFFRVPDDVSDTQVVILDDREDGPYFDLWTLFASARKPVRLRQLAEQPKLANAIHQANIIVPLAGSSNPMWKDDVEEANCYSMPLVSVFVQRVLGFYQVPDPAPRKADDPVTVTFVDRTGSRRLVDQSSMFEELKKRNPHIFFQAIDFGAIPFSEQLAIVRNTDLLVGVHGAGLTHSLFMREDAGAVVEIQPEGVNYRMFRNCAHLRGSGYYRVHAKEIKEGEESRALEEGQSAKRHGKRGDWHFHDVQIEPERFFDVVEAAAKSLYGNGVWDYDVN
ncbi:DUF563 domain-containing protein [Emericellopsis atlantica]|uniref:EGF domain-specific O-linked N-acetylglucosamine transferase n=1 Tax=Emericellopsis atlantica TaxID=2614577 RepID=A0A9P7ZL10_9HYPO|nr:DUF563 domain-containing protein [Emericellopsis atlantica]KAG9254074.1 DUF563 domain-containing protein [Emericellopsis atlantica]